MDDEDRLIWGKGGKLRGVLGRVLDISSEASREERIYVLAGKQETPPAVVLYYNTISGEESLFLLTASSARKLARELLEVIDKITQEDD